MKNQQEQIFFFWEETTKLLVTNIHIAGSEVTLHVTFEHSFTFLYTLPSPPNPLPFHIPFLFFIQFLTITLKCFYCKRLINL